MDRKAIARVVLAGVWRGFLASLLVPMLFMWRAILHPHHLKKKEGSSDD